MELPFAVVLVLFGYYLGVRSAAPPWPDQQLRVQQLEQALDHYRRIWRAARSLMRRVHRRERLAREQEHGPRSMPDIDSIESHAAGVQGTLGRLLAESEKLLESPPEQE